MNEYWMDGICQWIGYTTTCIKQNDIYTYYRVWVKIIVEDPTVTVKCKTAIKALFTLICVLV